MLIFYFLSTDFSLCLSTMKDWFQQVYFVVFWCILCVSRCIVLIVFCIPEYKHMCEHIFLCFSFFLSISLSYQLLFIYLFIYTVVFLFVYISAYLCDFLYLTNCSNYPCISLYSTNYPCISLYSTNYPWKSLYSTNYPCISL